MIESAAEVLRFWFGTDQLEHHVATRDQWFVKDDAFDAQIRARFGDTIAAAERGELDPWRAEPASCLALTIVCDQFPRNAYRGQARSFALEAAALLAARTLVWAGWDQQFAPIVRSFVYLPFEHSEALADQYESLRLMRALRDDPQAGGTWQWAVRHYEVIARFGRYPHRNQALGRQSTPTEQAFLAQPGSRF